MTIKVIHYINQFFAGIGGEEKADTKPFLMNELPPISQQLDKKLGDDFEVVATVVCGDTYFNENQKEAEDELLKLIKGFDPDYFIAGPAFNAGRYGVAAGAISKAVKDKLNIPVLTGMYEENPGCDMYRKNIYIISTKNSAAGMRKAIKSMTDFSKKYFSNEKIGSPEEDGYFSQGKRVNYFSEETGSRRAVDMLIKKINNEKFNTEYPMPDFDRVEPAPAIKDIKKARVALVTSGGIVPKGNPDKIESSSATKYGVYSFENMENLDENNGQTAHGGYDPVYANEDPDRVLPIDVLINMEKEGKIGSLHKKWYATTGNGTSIANAKKFASEIAVKLKNDGVEAVILTST